MSARFAPVSTILLGSFLLATLSNPALAQQGPSDPPIPHAQDRPPGPALSPAEAIARMKVPPGFSVELVASEPDLVNPVAMTFDERGRAWITESLEYPRKSAGPGIDRIKVLEDTDGDGKADKFTVFADGLNIPSGIAVGAGGVWVANAPDLLFLKDTDGDGKADTREVVVTGFGRYDTHELPNSLTWGPDGWLYGWNGVFNPAQIDYRGKRFEFTCAIFRVHPRTRDFEVFCQGTSNPWGIAFNEVGDAFASACVIDHLWHLTETGSYIRQGGPYPPFGWTLGSIVDHKHQKAAYCGIHHFDSDAYPERYRGKLFMGNIHGNGINVDRLEARGATYHGSSDPDFLQANDSWFMPVVQKTGPDGCLYVLDWYDRYHCYQDANRDPLGIDRLKGRLYRIRYRDSPRSPKLDLAAESDDQLIARLAARNDFLQSTARRLLSERNDVSSRPKLERLSLDANMQRKVRMEAVWTLLSAGPLGGDFHQRLLAHADPAFRAWGARAAGNAREVAPEVGRAVLALASDPAPEVRVQVAIAAVKLAGVDPLAPLMACLAGEGDDEILAPIVWQNLQPLLGSRGPDFVELVEKADLGRSPRLVDLLPRAVDRLMGGAPPQPRPAALLVAKLLERADDRAMAESVVEGVRIMADRLAGSASPRDRDEVRAILGPKLASMLKGGAGGPLGLDLALVAVAWNDPDALAIVRRTLRDRRADEEGRVRALKALVDRGDESLLAEVGPALADRKSGSASFRGEMLAALGRIDSPEVAWVVLESYPRLDGELRPKAVELLTQRAAWTRALLGAIEAKVVPTTALNRNQVRTIATSPDRDLAGRANAIWGVNRGSKDAGREAVIARVRAQLADARGNPEAGAVVFKNLCGQCHKMHGQGEDVGPEITLNGRGSYEQLLSNVFDPSLVIGPAYQATTVATADGRTLTGLVVEDTPRRVLLKLQGGKVEAIARTAIEELSVSPLSLMPEGFEAQLRPGELADLFAFLTLDKPPGDPAARPLPGTPPGIRR